MPRRLVNVLPLLLAIAANLGVFVFAMVYPILNELGVGVSPLKAYSAIDLSFYFDSLRYYVVAIDWLGGSAEWSEVITALDSGIHSFSSAPLFPVILFLSGYGPEQALPLATLFLLLSLGLVTFWLRWLENNGLSLGWRVAFALVPLPLWFMLNVSTDLLFAVFVAAFYWAYFEAKVGRRRTIVLSVALILAAATRPNALSLAAFLVVVIPVARVDVFRTSRWLVGAALLAGTGTLLLLYRDYFGAYLDSSGYLTYFWISQTDYLGGAFELESKPLDQAISVVILLAAKAAYLTGLRPSYGETHWLFVGLRAVPALILLPGLVWLLLVEQWKLRLFVALFLLPMLIGAAQERYILGIYPLLFASGVAFWQYTACRLVGKRSLHKESSHFTK